MAIGIILLFVGVTLAPTININTVKASTEDDLVEVTTQSCGIQGYGNTTVKLTREQYQNLEQYLVEFRARLNQTSTREEAVPIFKEAVVELDKYGLLPKGMSINRACRLLMNLNTQRFKVVNSLELDPEANYLCLVSGLTTETAAFGPLNNLAQRSANFIIDFGNAHEVLVIRLINLFVKITEKIGNLSIWLQNHNRVIFLTLMRVLWASMGISALAIFIWILVAGYFTTLFPFGLLSLLTFGSLSFAGSFYDYEYYSSSGWMFSTGLNGVKKYEGNELWGTAREESILTIFSYCFPGALGFIGLKIKLFQQTFFLGSALKVKLGTDRPPEPY
ncbi:MAG: hypothetical protein NTX92_01830 [Euryarchaeota archaeon]|nr:hypothetical protein [Euryarchaeota archaeon]